MNIEKIRILTRYDRFEKPHSHREKHPESEVETDQAVELDLTDNEERQPNNGQYPGLYNRNRKQNEDNQKADG